ncbi:MAG: Bax inhibitor-1/YccA family protein [Actinomycetaceae bacterium]|nr:Bax inhibitor-1/YccA family protein [Actinomycetaceae bacterium]
MANPVMNSLERTFDRTPAGYPTMPGYQPGQHGQSTAAPDELGARVTRGQSAAKQYQDFQQLEEAYRAPAADAVDQGRMTYDDVVMKTSILFGILVAASAVSWILTMVNPGLGSMLMMGGAIGGFILAMVIIFKKTISPATIMAYAVAEGVFLGSLSAIMEYAYPGIVIQAVIATFAVVGTTLVLFATGRVRNTPKMQRMVLIGLIGLIVYNVLSMILSATGVIASPWGIGSMTIMGIPIGIIVGVVAVILGAMALIGDFDIAQKGVENGVPAVFAWRVAFGVMVTVIWLYVEILRLLAILRGDN